MFFTVLLVAAFQIVAAWVVLKIAQSRTAGRLLAGSVLGFAKETEARMLWIGIIALAKQYDSALYQRLLGFPEDLPDLSRLRPPGGNTRRSGIEESYCAQRRNGTLPPTY